MAAHETVREVVDAHAYPMTGRLVDVGGHRLHLRCTGSGSPTVVLEPGGGDFSSAMGWIAPAVASKTRVCVYDRPGRGWSETADSPQDATEIASNLHALLHRAEVPGPYVLAGHSFGGLYVLTHADRYPADAAGLVLVDSTNPAPTTTQPRPRRTTQAPTTPSRVVSPRSPPAVLRSHHPRHPRRRRLRAQRRTRGPVIRWVRPPGPHGPAARSRVQRAHG